MGKKAARLPTVLSKNEVEHVIEHLHGTPRLIATMLYGAGLRLNECLRLRVKDIDFDYRQITVRDAKGGKDRVVPLPRMAVDGLKQQYLFVKQQHKKDLENGFGRVDMPFALAIKVSEC